MTDQHDATAGPLMTMHDIAREAGVSISTVSRALRKDQTVALETQRRVREIAAKLDYRLNSNASRLRRGVTQTVAIAIPALNSWYTAQLLAGAHAVLNSEGYDTVVAVISSAESIGRTVQLADPRNGRFDGVIIVDMNLAPPMIDELRETATTVVTTGRSLPYFSSIMVDDGAIARLATAHLIGLGHRRIGLITGNSDGPYQFAVNDRRRAGFLQALGDAEISYSAAFEARGNFALDGGYDAAAELFSGDNEPPTALFCMSDEMAIGAIHALQQLGLSVPDDVSVIGVDNHEAAASFGLTTIRQPVRQIGSTAASLMVEQLDDSAPAIVHQRLDTELIVRRTTRRWNS